MPEPLVLDASVAVAILEGEPGSDRLAAAIRAQVQAGGALLVPEHFWLETSNVLVRRCQRPLAAVLDGIAALDELGLETVPMDRALTLLALDLALHHGLTTYDAAYLAVAEVEEAALLTLRVALAAVAASRGRAPGGRRPKELGNPYGPDPARDAWARQGAYLAGIRARLDPADRTT